jgi:hypothetical protein
MVAIPALFMNLSEVTDLSVIGTLFAFTIVCAGVLVKDKEFAGEKRFVPYLSSRYIAPAIFIAIWAIILYYNGEAIRTFFSDFSANEGESVLGTFLHKVPYLVFVVFSFVMTIMCIIKRFSLIPVLGVMCCTYLMTELGWTNWFRFGIWLIVGLIVYFFYSYTHSKLHVREQLGEVST